MSGMEFIENFFYACLNGDVCRVQKYIDLGIDLNIKDDYGITAVHLACKSGNKQLLELLLDYGAPINDMTINNETPLHIAVKNGRCEIVDFLVRRNANLNINDIEGNTPLHIACINNDVDMVIMLINNSYNLNEKSKIGNTALHYACGNASEDIVKILIENGINLNEKNLSGKTPIDIACCNGAINIMALLIRNGAEVPMNVIDWSIHKEEYDLLNSIAQRKDVAKHLIKKLIISDKKHILRELRKNKVNFNSMEEVNDKSLLEIAINNKNIDIANILMSCNFGGVENTIQKLMELLNNNKVNDLLNNSKTKENNLIRVNKIEKENENIIDLLIQSRM